ncbi:unnamed protein product [Ilex paraguariensis]|uniref:Uncharacterized protein n=1 Tax=Ilex paraguariensis TaxID=185542 RepID=A0ABC8U219_9AQUA
MHVIGLEKWANRKKVVDLYVEHIKKSSSDENDSDNEEYLQGESSESKFFYDSKYDTENSPSYENAIDGDANFVGKGKVKSDKDKRVENNKQKKDQNTRATGMDNDYSLGGEDCELNEKRSLSGLSDGDEARR